MNYKGYDLKNSVSGCSFDCDVNNLSFTSVNAAMRFIDSMEAGDFVQVWDLMSATHDRLSGFATDFLCEYSGEIITLKKAIKEYSALYADDEDAKPDEVSAALMADLFNIVRMLVLNIIYSYTVKIDPAIYEDTAAAVLLSVTVDTLLSTIDWKTDIIFRRLSGFADWR